MLKHRTGDGTVFIIGQLPHDIARGIGDDCKSDGQFKSGSGFNFGYKAIKDLIKKLDMLFGKRSCTLDKEICNAFERLRPTLSGAVLNDVVKRGK